MKGFLVTLLLVFFLFGLPGRVFAAPEPPVGIQLGVTPWFLSTPVSTSQNLFESILDPTKNLNFGFKFDNLGSFINNASILLVGPVPVDENGQVLKDINGDTINMNNGAAGFAMAGIDVMVKNKPASSVDYIAYMGSKLHVPGTPEIAYAAGPGYGFGALQPILVIWTLMRNLAYFMFAMIFIIVGLMIMFRVKIDPKTVASIQNALPKIVFALVIVTFSYAIAGFMIDLMYVLMSLVFLLAKSIAPSFGPIATLQVPELETKILVRNNSIFDFILQTGWGLGASFNAAMAIWKVVFSFFFNPANIELNPLSLTAAPQNALNFTLGIFGFALGSVGAILAFFVFAVMIIWALLKTWLALLSAYVNILLGIMFAPLRLTLDAIPGQNQFINWIKDLTANLLVFPLVTALILIGGLITSFNNGVNAIGFVPPLIGNSDQAAVQALIGLGIFLTIPKALDILKEVLKAPAFKYGNAWMENMTPVRWGIQGGVGSLRNTRFDRVYGFLRGVGVVK